MESKESIRIHTKNQKKPEKVKKYKEFSDKERNWYKVNDLNLGDLIFTPWPKNRKIIDRDNIDLSDYSIWNSNDNLYIYEDRNRKKISRFINFDENFCKFIGRWVGDGWYGNSCIGLAFNSDEKEDINWYVNYFTELGIPVNPIKHKSKKLIQLMIYSSSLTNYIRKLFPEYKSKSYTKYIGKLKYLPDSKLKALLIGLQDSDGSIDYKARWMRESIDTTSIKLAEDIKEILLYFKIPCSVRTRPSYIRYQNGKEYICRESYKISFCGLSEKNNKHFGFVKEDGYYGYIIEKKEVFNYKMVYDISVENDFSYVTMNYSVHNSAAGCLVAYLTKITKIDPLKYGLLFERFLNPDRVGLPDIDNDFTNRDAVIEHLTKLHGKDKTTYLNVFKPFAAKSAIRHVGRILEIPLNIMDRIAKEIPDSERGVNFKFKNLKKIPKEHPLQKYLNDPKYFELFEYAKKFEGLYMGSSVHPSGIIISPDPMTDLIPTYTINLKRINENGTKKEERVVCSQFDMKDVEEVGLVKFDILAINSLNIIQKAQEYIRKNNAKFDIESIIPEDKKTFDHISSGDMLGIFQLEGTDLFRKMCLETRPSTITDISHIAALLRPGPLDNHMDDDYINAYKGKIKPLFNIPENREIEKKIFELLSSTKQLCIYQEQMMKLAIITANYTLAESDTLRKYTGKKMPEKLKKEREKFVKGCINNNLKEETGNKIFDMIEKFGLYSFNFAHSVSYSLISFWMAYLKTHYPAEYMAALIGTRSQDGTEKSKEYIPRYLRWCKEHGIIVKPPNIDISDSEFIIKRNEIYYGLSSIKGASKVGCNALITEREKNGKYVDIYELVNRNKYISDVNARLLKALTFAGTFDRFEHSRKELIEYGIKSAVDNKEIYGLWLKIPLGEYPKTELLLYELEYTGAYFSGHPLDNYNELDWTGLQTVDNILNNSYSNIQSLLYIENIKEVTIKTGKNAGKQMAVLTAIDQTGRCEVTLFSKVYYINKEKLTIGKVLYIEGKVEVKEFNEKKYITIIASKLEERKPIKPIEIFEYEIKTDKDFNNIISCLEGNDYLIPYCIIRGVKYKLNYKIMIDGEKFKKIKEKPL